MIMYSTFALLALMASTVVANPVPQAITSDIAPAASAPAGCSGSAPGTYVITIANASSPAKREVARERHLEPRVLSCGDQGTLVLTLANGQLHDAFGRIGYIASNFQWQFDGPPQAGAIYTGGFSLCGNNSLALGGSVVFYQCLSGTFYNLYDQSTGAQCSPAYIQMNACVGASGSNTVSGLPATTSGISTISSTTPIVTPTSTSIVAATSTTAAAVTSVITTAFPGGPIVSVSNATTSAITTAIPGGPIVSNTTFASGSVSTTAVATGPTVSSSAANSTVTTGSTVQSPSGSSTVSSAASPTVTPSTGAADVLPPGKQLFGLAVGFAALCNIMFFA